MTAYRNHSSPARKFGSTSCRTSPTTFAGRQALSYSASRDPESDATLNFRKVKEVHIKIVCQSAAVAWSDIFSSIEWPTETMYASHGIAQPRYHTAVLVMYIFVMIVIYPTADI
jgi:hypothetical protein